MFAERAKSRNHGVSRLHYFCCKIVYKDRGKGVFFIS